MIKKIVRYIAPAAIRRWLQGRKLRSVIGAYRTRVVEHRYGDVDLRIELADPLAEGWYDHDWDPQPEQEILARGKLRTGARVFDLGAHQGVVGLMLGHRVGATGQVVAVEPNPHNWNICRRNAALNGMDWVISHLAAVSDCGGIIPFNLGLNGQAAELSDYGGVFQTPVLTVNALIALYGPPDIVFVDVEGFECRVLAGASGAFANGADWFVEVHLGCGLEAAGGSAEHVLAYFPTDQFELFVHSEGDKLAIPIHSAPSCKLRRRFFLTALHRSEVVEAPK